MVNSKFTFSNTLEETKLDRILVQKEVKNMFMNYFYTVEYLNALFVSSLSCEDYKLC